MVINKLLITLSFLVIVNVSNAVRFRIGPDTFMRRGGIPNDITPKREDLFLSLQEISLLKNKNPNDEEKQEIKDLCCERLGLSAEEVDKLGNPYHLLSVINFMHIAPFKEFPESSFKSYCIERGSDVTFLSLSQVVKQLPEESRNGFKDFIIRCFDEGKNIVSQDLLVSILKNSLKKDLNVSQGTMLEVDSLPVTGPSGEKVGNISLKLDELGSLKGHFNNPEEEYVTNFGIFMNNSEMELRVILSDAENAISIPEKIDEKTSLKLLIMRKGCDEFLKRINDILLLFHENPDVSRVFNNIIIMMGFFKIASTAKHEELDELKKYFNLILLTQPFNNINKSFNPFRDDCYPLFGLQEQASENRRILLFIFGSYFKDIPSIFKKYNQLKFNLQMQEIIQGEREKNEVSFKIYCSRYNQIIFAYSLKWLWSINKLLKLRPKHIPDRGLKLQEEQSAEASSSSTG